MSEDENRQEEGDAAQAGELGEWLTAQREATGMSADAVAAALHLDRYIIDALEKEDFAAIGAPVFVKGHLRAVARHLGLDTDEAMRRFSASAGAEAAQAPELMVSYNRPLRRGNDRLKLAALVLAVAIIALLVVLFWPAGSPQPPADQPPDISDPQAGVAAQPATVVQQTAAQAPASSTATGGDFSAMLNQARATASQPEPAQPVTPERGLRLAFSGECWYEVRDATGARLAMGTGRAGASRTVTGARPFTVTLGVADAVTLTLDGDPLAISDADRRGRAATISVP